MSDPIVAETSEWQKGTLERRARLCLFLFFAFLFWGLYLKFGLIDVVRSNFNPRIPFLRRLYGGLSFNPRTADYSDVLMNAIAFSPLGVLLPLIHGRIRLPLQLLMCFSFSLAIELLQLFTAIGGLTVADLGANTIGFLLGLLFYVQVFLRLSDRARLSLITVSTACVSACVLFATVQLIILFPDYLELFIKGIRHFHLFSSPLPSLCSGVSSDGHFLTVCRFPT